jgi:hypothetical protein
MENVMATRKYLLIQRSVSSSGTKQSPPSPAQMQEMYTAFNTWKEKFKAEIADMGAKLKPGGKVVSTSGVSDGPFVEAKEIVGGYMIVAADSYERAVEVARQCPGLMSPGNTVEVRELASA